MIAPSDRRLLHDVLASILRRGRSMRAFCERVRERGDVAVVEEREDLPRLRAQYKILRGRLA